jgi:hypothetical protein
VGAQGLNTKDAIIAYLRSKSTISGDCIIFAPQPSMRYPRVYTTFFKRRDRIHCLAYKLIVGPIRKQLNHTCDNTRCWNIDHMYDGTQKQNCNDTIERSRRIYAEGEDHTSSKLTNEQRSYIVKAYDPLKRNGAALGRMFGISRPAVRYIARRGR